MKHEEYKDMLALEALGALDTEESQALGRHLATCDECRAELGKLQDTAAALAYTLTPVKPRPELRAQILERVKTQPQQVVGLPRVEARRETIPALTSQDAGAVPIQTEPKITESVAATSHNVLPFGGEKPLRKEIFMRRRPLFAFGAVAATIILAALVALLAVAWKRNNQMRAELAQLSNLLTDAQAEVSRTTKVLTQTQTELAQAREAGKVEDGEDKNREVENRGTEVEKPTASSVRIETSAAAQRELARLSAGNDDLRAQLARLSQINVELRTELERLSGRNGELQTRLAEATNSNGKLQVELARYQERNNSLQSELARSIDNLRGAQEELARAVNRNSELTAEVAELTQRKDALQSEIAQQREAEQLLSAPDTRAVALAGTGRAPSAQASLAFDRRTGRTLFFAYNLPPVPAGKAYQLWFIAGGTPLSAGVFIPDAAGRAVLRSQVPAKASKASTFAVTLEDAPGSRTPTGAKYLKGSI